MSLHHFFLDEQVIAQEPTEVFPLLLSDDDYKHARVIRLREGEHITVVDADNDYFELEIVSIAPNDLQVRVAQHRGSTHPSVPLVLVQGIAKGEKMDSLVRQCVEVGVDRILPCAMARSIVKLEGTKAQRRVERWQTIARSAAMQSGRKLIPRVDSVCAISDLLKEVTPCDIVLVFWEEAPLTDELYVFFQGQAFKDVYVNALHNSGCFYVVVGPEGGIDPQEIEMLEQTTASVFFASMGPTILRTETAAVVGCAEVALLQRALTASLAC